MIAILIATAVFALLLAALCAVMSIGALIAGEPATLLFLFMACVFGAMGFNCLEEAREQGEQLRPCECAEVEPK